MLMPHRVGAFGYRDHPVSQGGYISPYIVCGWRPHYGPALCYKAFAY